MSEMMRTASLGRVNMTCPAPWSSPSGHTRPQLGPLPNRHHGGKTVSLRLVSLAELEVAAQAPSPK
jgi:hypothetical protein